MNKITCFPLWGLALPMKRERWQAKPDGEGASAAEAKWLLRACEKKTREVLTINGKLNQTCQPRADA